MMETIQRFEEFRNVVGKPFVHRVSGDVFPFTVEAPSLQDVIDQARREPQARIATGKRGNTLIECLQDYREEFCRLPLEEAVCAPVHLTLFDLGNLAKPGGALYTVVEHVYRPLLRLWADQGLRWKYAWPILFLSGPGCSTNYHWDPDDVFFIMLSGHKTFYALKEPEQWLTPEMLQASLDNPTDLTNRAMPSAIREKDVVSFEMEAGNALWNPRHAPHWVDADDQAAFSLSIAFTDASFDPSANRTMETW